MSASVTTSKGTRLRNLRLHEVSLVDRPANEHATIALHKSDGTPAKTPDASSRRLERATEALLTLTGSGAVASRLLKAMSSTDAVIRSEVGRTIPESKIAELILDSASDIPARRAFAINALKRWPDLYKLVRENIA